ncbi:MAG: hypothetical protein WCV50_06905 [Patescibacteria group bacterium]|jgi:hypothetical protein
MTRHNQRGSLIIEVLVSISMAVIFSLAIGSLVGVNNRLTTVARHDARGLSLAKESMEQVFAAKQQSWASISGLGDGKYTIIEQDNLFQLQPDVSPTGEEFADGFFRTVEVKTAYRGADGQLGLSGEPDPNVRRLVVTVTWLERGANRDVQLEGFITNWKGN